MIRTAVDVVKDVFPAIHWQIKNDRLIGNANNSIYIEIYKYEDKRNQLICRIKDIFGIDVAIADEYTSNLDDLQFKLVALKVALLRLDVAFVLLLEQKEQYHQVVNELVTHLE